MTTGLTYTDYVNQIATLAVTQTTDPNLIIILPQTITYAENRIYRDLDLLTTVKRSSSYTIAAGTRNITVPVGDFVTVQEVNIILPAGTTNAETGTRSPLIPTTKEFLDYVYPSVSNSDIPQYFAMLTQSNMVVGPWANNTYYAEVVGTYRPDSLSAVNTTTFISQYLPDLLIMASMIYVSGYQRNFGRQSDDPAMAQSYENQYQTLLKGSLVEEFRKKFQAGGWTSMTPAVVASPTRG